MNICVHLWFIIIKKDGHLKGKEFYGSIINLLFNAEDFIRNNSKTRWRVEGMRRQESSDYPAKSVREVLVNAIIHRDYQILGSEIHVDMYDDRLEITSPGGMPDGSRIQDLDLRNIPSMRRNHIISDIFLRFEYMDRRGSGINRIMKDYSDCPVKPTFFSEYSWFRVSMPNRNVVFQEKTSFSKGESALLGEKAVLSDEKSAGIGGKSAGIGGKSAGIGDQEILAQGSRLEKKLESLKVIKKPTKDKILKIYREFGIEFGFDRDKIASLLGIKDRWARTILDVLLEYDLIEKVKKGEYVFKRMVEYDR